LDVVVAALYVGDQSNKLVIKGVPFLEEEGGSFWGGCPKALKLNEHGAAHH